ncbi:MAG TPA: hypothetical protein VEV81_14680, partial [Pyrinomonadaceae bacterium]|nr:hypothetical protein [Pyrinomonadaceae bacterium]
MGKILLAVISGVAGIVLGVLLVLFLIGSPKAKPLPGAAVKAPEPGGDPPGTAVITLDEKFFDSVLGTIFRDLGSPSFPLELTGSQSGGPLDGPGPRMIPAALQNQCQDRITITSEGSNVKTGVRFTGGKINAVLPFNGSKSFFGCLNFNGWAQASIDLSFDKEKQTVYGKVIIEGVNVEGIPDVASGLITRLVQSSIDQRINPLEILRAPQLAVAMPVQSTNGTL